VSNLAGTCSPYFSIHSLKSSTDTAAGTQSPRKNYFASKVHPLVKLPEYISNKWLIVWMLPILTIVVNLLLFHESYLLDLSNFVFTTFFTGLFMFFVWHINNWLAITLRNRFPEEKFYPRRIMLNILLMILLNSLELIVLGYAYESVSMKGISIDEHFYRLAVVLCAVFNPFLMFLHEGIAGFEKWKKTLTETEQLRKEFVRTNLIVLKSQVNPHFLFNNLNTLSSLIQENSQKAERLLNEMTKVYRYLLQNQQQLVSLERELSFIESYYYIQKQRYNSALQIRFDITPEVLTRKMPTLTLQLIVEHIIRENVVGKDQPLEIRIRTKDDQLLEIQHNVQAKTGSPEPSPGLENIMNKYRLLAQKNVAFHEDVNQKTYLLPLVAENYEIEQPK
jgi:two-component system, LytTR family, sensor kinase